MATWSLVVLAERVVAIRHAFVRAPWRLYLSEGIGLRLRGLYALAKSVDFIALDSPRASAEGLLLEAARSPHLKVIDDVPAEALAEKIRSALNHEPSTRLSERGSQNGTARGDGRSGRYNSRTI